MAYIYRHVLFYLLLFSLISEIIDYQLYKYVLVYIIILSSLIDWVAMIDFDINKQYKIETATKTATKAAIKGKT